MDTNPQGKPKRKRIYRSKAVKIDIISTPKKGSKKAKRKRGIGVLVNPKVTKKSGTSKDWVGWEKRKIHFKINEHIKRPRIIYVGRMYY